MILLRRSLRAAALLAGLASTALSGSAFAAPAARTALPGLAPSLVSVSSPAGPVAPNTTISFVLTLPLRNQPKITQLLSDLYDPASKSYGQYLTPQQFADQFGPTQADYSAVISWAKAQGLTVTGTHPERTLLDLSGSAAAVQQAFQVTLNYYESPSGRLYYSPSGTPSLPAGIALVTSGVVGLDNAAVRVPNITRPVSPASILEGGSAAAPPAGSGPGGTLIPSDIRTVYNLNGAGLDGAGQTLGLFELDSYSRTDALHYEKAVGLPSVPLENVFVDVTDPKFPLRPGAGTTEVMLDIDLQAALAPKAAKIIVYIGPNTGQGVLDTYQQIATENRAKQISTSWGLWEDNLLGYDFNTGQVYLSGTVNAENAIFTQMAIQGQTIFAAAGDNGGVDRNDQTPFAYFAQDPAAQPLMCSVGGTSLTVVKPGADETYKSETTWNFDGNYLNGAGGGGVSIFWPQFTFQSRAVQFATAASGVSKFARNVPDVSLNSDPNTGYLVYVTDPAAGAGFYQYGGTSAAAPLWAAFTALVNQQRAALGKGVIGFISPALYSYGPGGANASRYGADFHDIKDGSNNIPYPAIPGYDLATGLGTMNGGNLLADLVARP